MEKRCDECGAKTPRPGANGFAILDYCAECSRDLCDACMEMGCCGNVPALSGMRIDGDEDLDGDALPATLKCQGCGQDFSEAAPHTIVTARVTQCAACCAGSTEPNQLEPA